MKNNTLKETVLSYTREELFTYISLDLRISKDDLIDFYLDKVNGTNFLNCIKK